MEFNPNLYCPCCGCRWDITKNNCEACTFNPVDNPKDAVILDAALDLYLLMQAARNA